MMKGYFLLASALLSLFLVTHHKALSHASDESPKKAIILVPLPNGMNDKFQAQLARAILEGVRLYVDQAARIPGIELEVLPLEYDQYLATLTEEEIESKPKKLKQIQAKVERCVDYFQKSVGEKGMLVAVIGHPYSREAELFGAEYNNRNILFVSPTATNPKVTSGKPLVFSMTYNDRLQSAYLTAFLDAYLKSSISTESEPGENLPSETLVLYGKDLYGKGLFAYFEEQTKHLNLSGIVGKPISTEMFLDNAKNPLPGLLSPTDRKIRAVIVLAHAAEALPLITLVRKYSSNNTVTLCPDAIANVDLLRELGDGATGVASCSPFRFEFGTSESRAFEKNYLLKTGRRPSIASALAYDSMFLIAAALNDSYFPHAQVASQPAAYPGELKDFLRKLDAKKSLQGITGKLFFDKDGFMMRDGIIMRTVNRKLVPWTYVLRGQLKKDGFGTGNSEASIATDTYSLQQVPVVYTGCRLMRLNRIDVANQTYDAEFLVWFKGDGKIVKEIEDSEIKLPDLVKQRRKKPDRRIPSETPLSAEPQSKQEEQESIFFFEAKGEFACTYDVTAFPFDTQSFALKILLDESQSDKFFLWRDQQDLMSPKDRDPKRPGIWDKPVLSRVDVRSHIEEAPIERRETVGTTGANKTVIYPSCTFEFDIRRKTGTYVVSLFVPLFILIVVGSLSFGVPVRRFEVRITLAVTALLSMVVHHLSQLQPIRAAGTVAHADLFFIGAYIFMAVVIGLIIFVNNPLKNVPKDERLQEPEDLRLVDLAKERNDFLFWFVLFPVTFFVFVFIYEFGTDILMLFRQHT